jgi:hypothetical protein
MLGKRWDSDRPVIVKANVPVNFIADRVLALDPGAPAIALHFPLAEYVAAILRTEGHVRWTESVFAELRIAQSPYVADAAPRWPAEMAAAMWFAQLKAIDDLLRGFPASRSLDASAQFDRPGRSSARASSVEPHCATWNIHPTRRTGSASSPAAARS